MFTITVSKIIEVQKDFSPRIVKAKGSIQQYQIGMKMNLTMNNTVFKHNELIFGKLTVRFLRFNGRPFLVLLVHCPSYNRFRCITFWDQWFLNRRFDKCLIIRVFL